MNITIEEKLLLKAYQHPQYIMNNPNNKKAQAYLLLVNKGLIAKHRVDKYTSLYEFTIKRPGVHRLRKLQAQDAHVISFTDLSRKNAREFILELFCWILIGLSIATGACTFLFNFPNLTNCFAMIGFYAIIMIGCVCGMPNS